MRPPLASVRPALNLLLPLWLLLGCGALAGIPPQMPGPVQTTDAPTPLPNRPDSLKLAVIGDFGNGTHEQYEVAQRMAEYHARFRFTLVLTVGDNLYGGENPRDFETKFEKPYAPLLDAGVKFYASLGNHDRPEQRFYEPFNMNGRTYYTLEPDSKQSVRFFALQSDSLTPAQLEWIEEELKEAGEDWKIAYFHHPLYSSGGRHGSSTPTRAVLEPLFLQYGVSVVFAGHDHFYERIKPQQGIQHFVIGAAGQLRRGDIRRNSPLTAFGFDQDRSFFVAEIDGDQMFFQAVSRLGVVVDSGVVTRRGAETTSGNRKSAIGN